MYLQRTQFPRQTNDMREKKGEGGDLKKTPKKKKDTSETIGEMTMDRVVEGGEN